MVRPFIAGIAIVAAAVIASTLAAVAKPTVLEIMAIGTAFRVTLSDGSTKQGSELAGAVLVFNINGAPVRIRIAAITPDPSDKTGSVLLHDFRREDTGEPLCSSAPDGTRLGFPLAGRTAADGRFIEAEDGAFELVCTSGAKGKCVRFGYHPWAKASDGRPLRDYYNACVRLVRADYCGDGRAWTRDGTLIDLWDEFGIQRPQTATIAHIHSRRAGAPAVQSASPALAYPRTSGLISLGIIVRDWRRRPIAMRERLALLALCFSIARVDWPGPWRKLHVAENGNLNKRRLAYGSDWPSDARRDRFTASLLASQRTDFASRNRERCQRRFA
jgi:hypothetical protein